MVNQSHEETLMTDQINSLRKQAAQIEKILSSKSVSPRVKRDLLDQLDVIEEKIAALQP